MIKLMHGDCLQLMANIPDNSVDMILCDLPYGTTRNKWDVVIPFDELWVHYKRVIKDNGAVVLFGSEPFSSKLRISNIDNYKYDWIWEKPKGTGHLNAKRQPMRNIETISIFYKKQCTYNPQMEKGTPYKNKAGKNHHSNNSMTDCYGAYKDFRYDNSGFRYPKQLLKFGVVERNTVHPTQKPTDLLEYLIKTYTNDDEIVLDNCMGSGSTGVACVNTKRNFIGIEKNEKYFNIAYERIAGLGVDGVKVAII
jgi:site-specific DNA-methyltransferase (adenine-specific)